MGERENLINMTGASVILIVFGVFAAVFIGTMAVFFGRIVWAMRDPEKFRAFQERENAADAARREKYEAAERERRRLGKASWAGLFFGAVLTLVGVVIVVYSIRLTYDLARAQTWARAECTILRSGIQSSSSARSATVFRAGVEYSYVFAGKNYTGRRLNLAGGSFHSFDEARRALADFPPGARVACYVDPAQPTEAVLERSPLQFPLSRYGAGLLICFGIGGFLLFVSRPRKPLADFTENEIRANMK